MKVLVLFFISNRKTKPSNERLLINMKAAGYFELNGSFPSEGLWKILQLIELYEGANFVDYDIEHEEYIPDDS